MLLQRRLKGVAGKMSSGLTIQPRTRADSHLPSGRIKHPLSFAEERLWFLDQWEPNSALYNIPFGIRLHGVLNLNALQQTLDAIVRRHETLRTRFEVEEGRPWQVVGPPASLVVPLEDLSGLAEEEREPAARRICETESRRPFDLKQHPLLRAKLIRLQPTEHLLFLNAHHIVSDGWSVGVFLQEWRTLYAAFAEGKPSPLPELAIQYGDYAVWQRQWLQGDVLTKQLDYWRKQLAGAPPLLELPSDRPRPAKPTYRGAELSQKISAALAEELSAFNRRENVTLFMTLLTTFHVLLHRYSGQEDISVGTPIAGRNQAEVEELIGFFANTLVMRGDLSGDPTCRTALARMREVAYGAYAHQDVPFERLVQELQPKRDQSYAPLFQVMFVLVNTNWEMSRLPGVEAVPVLFESGTAKFDLLLSAREGVRSLELVLEYSTDLFDAATIRRLLGHYLNLLEAIVTNPEQRISELPLLTTAERQQLLIEWNKTAKEYPRDKCVHVLFEEQVARSPSAVALRFGEQQLTYLELNERANQLARHLQKLGVGPDALVGICVERSMVMVIGVLGILKAGGAYVPLDPEYPPDRLKFMLADAGVSVLLTSEAIAASLPTHSAKTILLDADWPLIANEHSANVTTSVMAEHLAYVIYTSGSTGRPKGVAMRHGPLTNLITWQLQEAVLRPARTLQFASLSFDVSFQEIFATLCGGGTLLIVPQTLRRDLAELLRYLINESAERIFLPFVVLQHFAEIAISEKLFPTSLRELITAGEQLRITPQIASLFERLGNCRLQNQYGPTESHVVTAYTLADPPKDWMPLPPIGRPLPNVQIYLLDRQLQPVPVGLAGELYIGGEALARGYLNRPELTAGKFIPDPFNLEPNARLYKTGDSARYLPGGEIEYLGRLDQQVKVRGFRIELGEIESALLGHPVVREAVVMVREDFPGDKKLVAYLTLKAESAPTTSEWRGWLQAQLPEYMVPSAFVTLRELPVTLNGKVDRKNLPSPEFETAAAGFMPPTSTTELALAKIWCDILRLKQVGGSDNFFEIGGHSLLATQIISRLNRTFAVGLSLRSLFEHPTLTRLAKQVDLLLWARQGVQKNAAKPDEQLVEGAL